MNAEGQVTTLLRQLREGDGRALRQILVDRACRYATLKRGGAWRLEEPVVAVDDQADMLLALDDALARLAALDARLGRSVECRFFAGG